MLRALIFAWLVFVLGGKALAQDERFGPPPALQFPYEQIASASRAVQLNLVRISVESETDRFLCEYLTENASVFDRGLESPEELASVDENGEPSKCRPRYARRVASNEGKVHWQSGFRPEVCGTSCFSHPRMTSEQNLLSPNLRRAEVTGTIRLEGEGQLGISRKFSIGYTLIATCKTSGRNRNGNLVLETRFDRPVVDDGGYWEGFLNFFSGGALSDYIGRKLNSAFADLSIAPPPSDRGTCSSIGINVFPAEPLQDAVTYNLPVERAGGSARSGALADVALPRRDKVRVDFLRVRRHPLPVSIPGEFARPGDPLTAQHHLFANGKQITLPPGIKLPTSGGSVDVNYCVVLDVTDYNVLQLLYVNDIGAAVWSEPTRGTSFGAGSARLMTTSRNIVTAARGGGRPIPAVLREFELTYRITYLPGTSSAVLQPGEAGIGGSTTGGVLDERAPVVGENRLPDEDANRPAPSCVVI